MKKLFLVLTLLYSVSILATPVNINTADAAKISASLTGFGLKKAQVIVDYRTKNGDFKTLDDLNKVPGIGDKTIEKIKADVLFSEPLSNSSTVSLPETAVVPSSEEIKK